MNILYVCLLLVLLRLKVLHNAIRQAVTHLVKRWRRVSSITLFLISRRIIFAHLLGASPRDLWLLANVTQNGRQKDHVVLEK